MIRKNPTESSKQSPVAEFDRVSAMLSLIDYLIGEAKRSDPMVEYFLQMARLSLLEEEQARADVEGRN
ncbi:hypothetical protein [Methylosinus sp. Ce-a6]|uniref:hypothetical protein n=1 Tax=Methylosinus sp. Ce-a6 TaxID=2172005 RepID=UPI001358C52B|nr:hypothetical protein [Methylosinus sp. Ce-a6]